MEPSFLVKYLISFNFVVPIALHDIWALGQYFPFLRYEIRMETFIGLNGINLFGIRILYGYLLPWRYPAHGAVDLSVVFIYRNKWRSFR